MSAPEPTAEEVAAFNREEGTATPTPAPVDAAERVRAYLRGVADMRPGEWVSTSTIVGALGLTFPDADGWLTALEHRREVESLDYGIWWRIVSMKRTSGAETQPAPPPVATAPAVDLDAIAAALNAYHEASMDLGRACTASSARAEWCAANDARAEVDRLIAAITRADASRRAATTRRAGTATAASSLETTAPRGA